MNLKKFEDVGEFIASVYVMNEMAFRINSEMFFGGLKFENLPTYYERLLKRESETNREMSEWLKTADGAKLSLYITVTPRIL